MTLYFNKNGIISEQLVTEIHVEPDGSKWFPVFLHVNPTGQKFSSGDTFSTGVLKNETLWLNFNICKVLTSWEFLAMQADTETSTVKKYRWTQTKSPFNSSWSDVQPSAVTRNASSGYTDAGATYGGGFYVANSDNTYIITANTSNGNWWGAVGCKAAYEGGIPGFGGVVCKSGFMSAYVRVTTNTLRMLGIPSSAVAGEEIIEM